MTQLTLRPEVQCWPTWIREGRLYSNVDPESLRISPELSACLRRWSDRWDSTYDLVNDPGNPRFSSADRERAFWREGTELAQRLREELGTGWTVEYDPTTP
jgi:hypothetical protein